jgi:hypothetical protein
MVHLFKCPKKWPAWELALSRQNPHMSFRPDDIEAVLFSLKRVDYVHNSRLFVLCSNILLGMWRAHWRFVFDQIPLNIDLIIDQAFRNITCYLVYIRNMPLINDVCFLLFSFLIFYYK